MKTEKRFFVAIMLLLVGLLAASAVTALPTVEYLKINEDIHEPDDSVVVERGETLELKLKLHADHAEENVQAEADILGYEYNDWDEEDISDKSHVFDMEENDTKYIYMTIVVPKDTDKDLYDLRVRVATRTGTAYEGLFRLRVSGVRHNLEITDVVFSPENSVLAGRALLASVRIENLGEKDEKGVKVAVSIPELGISATDYIDEIEKDDETTSEELYLRVPKCAEPGRYDVNVVVTYDRDHEEVSTTESITVLEGDACEVGTGDEDSKGKTVITYDSESKELPAGEGGAVYPITLSNTGSESKTYTLTADGDWATFRMSPSNVVIVDAGESKTVYVYVTANDEASVGQHMFAVTISSNGKVLEQLPMTATVVKGVEKEPTGWSKVKRGLEIGLVILVILLVILGLVIGFNKLRGSEDEEFKEEAGQTYY